MRRSGRTGSTVAMVVVCVLASAAPAVAKRPTRKELAHKVTAMITDFDKWRGFTRDLVAGMPIQISLCDTLKSIPTPPGPPQASVAAMKSYGRNIARQVPSLEDYNKQLEQDIASLTDGGPPTGVDKFKIKLDWDSSLTDLNRGHKSHADEFPALAKAANGLGDFNCNTAHAEFTQAAIAGDIAWSSLQEAGGLASLAELVGIKERPDTSGDVYPGPGK